MTEKYADTFCIEFDTNDMPGLITCTQVSLKKRIMGPKDVANVALSNHPLYRKLFDYCMNNPPSGTVVNRKKAP